MSCGGRVYKGDTVTISVPFDIEDYSNLTITYTTIGDAKIEKTQDEVEIEDGYITYTFEPGELDLLPDGVIYYTISCDVNGVPNVDSTNTNLYLKTPAGYSGLTADEIYQSGYTAGLNACSGSTDCSSAVTESYQSGVTAGMAEQKALLVSSAFTRNGTYTRENGWNEIEVDVPHFLPAEEKTLRLVQHVPGPWEVVASYPIGMSKVTVEDDGYGSWKYDQGYQAGIAQCSGGTCPTETGLINLDSGWSGYESYQPLGSGYFDEVIVTDNGYGQAKFDEGYELGLATCSASSGSCLIEDEQTASLNYDWTGFTIVYPTEGYDGLGRVLVADLGYGQRKYDEGYAEGLSSQCDLVPLGVVVHAGDSGVIDNITPDSAAGFSSVSVDARDYGAYLYTSGYNAGLYDCSATTCNLRPFDYQIYPSWDGYMSFSASQASLDGFSSVSIIDLGYGQAKYDQGYDDGYLSGASTTDCSQAISMAYDNGHYLGYNEGKDSVIKSLLTENDTDLVIGYYYTSARTMCLITGEYHDSNIDYDGNSAFVSMSVNGGSWQPVEKYLELPAGWSQVRFSGCTTLLLGAFSHRFTPSQQCDMDALKIVSLPTMVDGLSNTYTFHMNDGLRVIASSCGIMRGATNGADNINVLITHYTGNQREYNYFPSNGVLFIPEGSTADWASILPNWLHLEMF